MRRRSRVGSRPAARSPATSTSPAVGSSKRLMSFRVVVLPDPLRPSRTRVSPAPTVKDTFSTRLRSEEHTSELQSQSNLVCRLLLEKKKKKKKHSSPQIRHNRQDPKTRTL